MNLSRYTASGIFLISLATSPSALAQPNIDDKLSRIERQIADLEKQLKNERKLREVAERSHREAATKAPSFPAPDVTVRMPNNRPTLCTTDGENCVSLTGRLHYDIGVYSYDPRSAFTTPQNAQNGENARRAQIGIAGRFARDWHYALSIDGGGSPDGNVILHNALFAYRGFNNTVLEAGYMNVNSTIEGALGSNTTMFIERPVSSNLATDVAAGDFRSAIGGRVWGDRWWAGVYLTGPTTNSANNRSNRPQVGSTYRVAVLPIQNETTTVMLGADAALLHDAGQNDSYRMSDRIELRVDPGVRLLDTGIMTDIKSARVFSGGAAISTGSFFAQGEYFDYNFQRNSLPDLQFNGGYVYAAYVLTGERRTYTKENAAFDGMVPAENFDFQARKWGVWELAARYSYANLNDKDIRGGKQNSYTVGLNWYINRNMRFMFNWIHGEVEKYNFAGANTGAKYDAFAMRTQFAF